MSASRQLRFRQIIKLKAMTTTLPLSTGGLFYCIYSLLFPIHDGRAAGGGVVGRNRRRQTEQRAVKATSDSVPASAKLGAAFWNRCLLGAALLAASIVYWPASRADWFYDDVDYIVSDPRLDHIELFLPGHWHDPPPPLNAQGISVEQLPGYGKPLIEDRYVWRLSFALERYFHGKTDSSALAHAINLLLHLGCICALFAALRRLLALYGETEKWAWCGETKLARGNLWPLLPGVTALIFAIHPWAAEPVCYATARSASLGTFFVLTCIVLTALALDERRSNWIRVVCALAVLFCAILAFGCKENFVTALPGCVFVVVPVVWQRIKQYSRATTVAIAGGILACLAVVLVLAIRSSNRAQGLFEQSSVSRSWPYFFEIQNPLVLLTLLDQLPVRRIAVEFNHPGWDVAACWVALSANIIFMAVGTFGGFRFPVFLALGWFYLHLLPTNSFLVRQDFLAARNVYLPVCGTSVLFAGAFLWLGTILDRETRELPTVRRRLSLVAFLMTSIGIGYYWSAMTMRWASAFGMPDRVWEQSAKIAPDHATVRLNYGIALLNPTSRLNGSPNQMAQVEHELLAALAAEASPTMQYHNPSHRITRRAVAWRILGEVHRVKGENAKAEHYFEDAWHAKPALIGAWAAWVDIAFELRDNDALRRAVPEGLAAWPGSWWPIAVRGMADATDPNSGRSTSETLADLKVVMTINTVSSPELRVLLARALYLLTQRSEMREHLPKLKARLRNLRVP